MEKMTLRARKQHLFSGIGAAKINSGANNFNFNSEERAAPASKSTSTSSQPGHNVNIFVNDFLVRFSLYSLSDDVCRIHCAVKNYRHMTDLMQSPSTRVRFDPR